jgi:hypothetical protein
MNLLMTAPLCDSRGKIRYFIGAQVDVSGLVKECTELESLQKLLELQERGEEAPQLHKPSAEKSDELRELGEMLNQGELSTIHRFGGRMHRETTQDDSEAMSINWHQPRVLSKEPDLMHKVGGQIASGGLAGVYQNVKDIFPPRQTCQVLTKLIVLTGSTIPFTENLVHISVVATTWHSAVTVPE